ncbi:DUF2207 domain-containing protein [Tranquillimonas rosea]|nr:DUF2207 domain-containing protein [Tranquillimonas rosea]
MARRMARRAAFSFVAVLFLLAGIAFLCVAAFLMLAASHGAIFAATVIGVVFLGVALILFGIAMLVGRRPVAVAPAPMPMAGAGAGSPVAILTPVIAALAMGISQGMAARRAMRRPRSQD